MNVTEIIAIKFPAHQHKHVTVHTAELTNRTRKGNYSKAVQYL